MSLKSKIQAFPGYKKIMDSAQTLGLCLLTVFLLPPLLISVSKQISFSVTKSLNLSVLLAFIVQPACFTQETEEHFILSKELVCLTCSNLGFCFI